MQLNFSCSDSVLKRSLIPADRGCQCHSLKGWLTEVVAAVFLPSVTQKGSETGCGGCCHHSLILSGNQDTTIGLMHKVGWE